MEFFFILILAIYFGVGLYEIYKSCLMGQVIKECILNGVFWPADVYLELKQLIKANFIDKEGP